MKRALPAIVGLVVLSAIPRAQVSQGPVAYWSADQLKTGRAAGLPLTTPTHRFTVVTVAPSARTIPESHEGATSIFFVVAGLGTLTYGGPLQAAALSQTYPASFVAVRSSFPLALTTLSQHMPANWTQAPSSAFRRRSVTGWQHSVQG
jgi:uncharacterized RmlC-like cupin family protein